MSDVRIVQFATLVEWYEPDTDGFQVRFNGLTKENAAAELASLYKEGYEIFDVAVGGNERILLTVYTLRPVEKMEVKSRTVSSDVAQWSVAVTPQVRRVVPETQPPPMKSDRLTEVGKHGK